MKKLVFTSYILGITIFVVAQNPNLRVAKTDTSGKNSRTSRIPNTRITTIPGLRTITPDSIIDSRNQVAIVGLVGSGIQTTNDRNYLNYIKVLLNKKESNSKILIPSNSCPDMQNCVFFNNISTFINGADQFWAFIRDEAEIKAPIKKIEMMRIAFPLQPVKKYLLSFDVDVIHSSPNVFFEVTPVSANGVKHLPILYHLFQGNNQISFEFYPGSWFQSKGAIPQTGHFTVEIKHGETVYDQVKKYWIKLKTIHMKEMDIKPNPDSTAPAGN